MRLRRVEVQADVILARPDSRVDAKDICEVSQDLAPEVSRAGVIGSELRLETIPRNQRGFS